MADVDMDTSSGSAAPAPASPVGSAAPAASTPSAPASPATTGRLRAKIQQHRLPFGITAIALGIILVVVATAMLTDSRGEIRVSLAVVGLVLAFFGLDSVFKFIWGEKFQTGLWLSVGWIVLVCLAAVLADLLPLQEARDAAVTLREGTKTRLRPDLLSAHPFGTDRQALDVLGGVIYGARVSLQVSLLAVAIGITVGGVIGVAAGFFQKQADAVISVFTDAVLAFPPLILLLGLATVLEPTPTNMAFALAALGIPTYIRLARANTLVFIQREFVLAARAMGAGRGRIIFRELVPNVALPLASYAFIIVALLIVAEASLSFLGLGIQRPEPTWGNMIAAGQDDFDRHPHLVFIPGLVMFMTVFALNRVGEKAISLWDPRVSKM